MSRRTATAPALAPRAAADRHSRAVDHLILGQRPRDDLSQPDARSVPARPRGAVPRMRQAVVPRASRSDAAALRHRAPLRGARANCGGAGSGEIARRRSGHRRLLCAGRHRGRAAGSARSRRGIVAFYDIDTPVTLAALADGTCAYLDAASGPGFDLYLSFTGGPVLRLLETRYRRARRAGALLRASIPNSTVPVRPAEPRLGAGLSRHLQRRPSAGARRAAVRAGAANGRRRGSRSPGRSIRPDLQMARQCRAHRACRPGPACRGSTGGSASR